MEKTRTRGLTALQTRICFGEPRIGDSAPCDLCADLQRVDLGAKNALFLLTNTAMLRKASDNNPSPSNAEGEIFKRQKSTVWWVSALHGSKRKKFAAIYCIFVEKCSS